MAGMMDATEYVVSVRCHASLQTLVCKHQHYAHSPTLCVHHPPEA